MRLQEFKPQAIEALEQMKVFSRAVKNSGQAQEIDENIVGKDNVRHPQRAVQHQQFRSHWQTKSDPVPKASALAGLILVSAAE